MLCTKFSSDYITSVRRHYQKTHDEDCPVQKSPLEGIFCLEPECNKIIRDCPSGHNKRLYHGATGFNYRKIKPEDLLNEYDKDS